MKTTASFFSKHFAFSSLLMTALLLTACEDNPFDGLPPATQEGKNVMAFKVNGKAWKNDASVWDPGVEASYGKQLLLFSGFNKSSSIGFTHSAVQEAGTYELYYGCRDYTDAVCVGYTQEGKRYIPLDRSAGYFEITALDTASTHRFISGTFHVDLINEADITDTLHITDGRFDIQI